MADYVAKRDPNRCPTHPGELLREDVIPATGKTRSEIAALLGISRQHLYDILTSASRFPRRRRPARQAVRRWRGGLGANAERIRYLECGTRTVRRDQENTHNQNEGGVKRWSGMDV